MKTLHLICSLLAGLSLSSFAFEIPRGVYRISELDGAIHQATEKQQPLIFVLSDLNTTCGLCIGSTEDSFKSFRSRGTIVYIDSKSNEIKKAPKAVMQLRLKPSMGRIIPMVMVTTADGSKGLRGFSYEELKGGQAGKAARELRRALEGVDVLGGNAAKDEPAPAAEEPEMLAPEQTWQNAEGKTITAAVKQIDATKVTFVLQDGKTVSYPLDKLSEESREKLRELAE